MKVTVTIERNGTTWTSCVTCDGDGVKANIDLAVRCALFNMNRRPCCSCDGSQPEGERCTDTVMRCYGAISAHLATNGPVAAIEVPGAKGNEGADHECG